MTDVPVTVWLAVVLVVLKVLVVAVTLMVLLLDIV